MPIVIAWCLSALMLFVGCGGASKEAASLDADVPAEGCVVDSSKGADSATPLALGEKATGQICPRGDSDFFAVEVPAGKNLLDISLAYPSVVSKVTLHARLFEADGTTPVPLGEAVDDSKSDGKNSLVTTFHIPKAGRYLLRVADSTNGASDSVNSYVMLLSAATDPDTHEANDTQALAKAADGLPGFFSYVGDVDVYMVPLATAGSLLSLRVHNPVASKAVIEYTLSDGAGKIVGTGKIEPAEAPKDLTQPALATGNLYLALRYAPGSAPDRRAEAGYGVTLGEIAEGDSNEKPVRNDIPTQATCLSGAASPCGAVFAGTLAAFPAKSGTIGSRGDRDYYVFKAQTVPAVVEATLKAPATALDFTLDVLLPHPGSPCKADAECKVLPGACKTNDDCEWSHECIAATSGACTTTTCRQCAGAGVCLPMPDAPGQSFCGVTIFSTRDMDGGQKTGADGMNIIRTAQPVLAAGPVYIVVHEQKDDQFDPATAYTLDVRVAPEPDALDAVADPAGRNNYFNPYPLQTTSLTPQKSRAKDVTAQITTAATVSGFISYQTDEDWFQFSHPCPGSDCGLIFEWVQPGPSPVRPVFFLRSDSLSLHESWTYGGSFPLTAPITDTFGDGDCTECSFAAKKHTASGTTPFKYFLQVRDVGADDWDFSASGRYEFRLKTITPGCPASCSEAGTAICGCFCKAQNQCPAGPAL